MKKLLFVVAALGVGCGGSDGVSDSKKLSDLSAAETKNLCEDFVGDYPERTVTCDGATFTLGFSADDCTGTQEPAPATCTATVGQFRACYDDLFELTDAQLCDPNTPSPTTCAALESCG